MRALEERYAVITSGEMEGDRSQLRIAPSTAWWFDGFRAEQVWGAEEAWRDSVVHISGARQTPVCLDHTRTLVLERLTGVTVAPLTTTVRDIPSEGFLTPRKMVS